jgi:hypothetical protein
MNITTLENTLYTWLASVVTPVPVIWEHQNAPRPSGGYVGMTHNAERALGLRGYKSAPVGTLNTVTVTQDVEFMWMLQGFGATGSAAIYLVLDALQLPIRRNALSVAGVACVGNEGIQNISEVVNSRFESRRALDLRMRVGNVLTYASNIIETVDMRLILKDEVHTVVDEIIHT